MICMVYYGYQYREIRDSIVFRKRFGHISLYEVFFMVFNFLSTGLFIALSYLYPELIMLQILYFLADTAGIIVFWMWTWRFWLIHYNIQWTTAYLKNKWKHGIDPLYIKITKTNWYISHKTTYGNNKWIFSRFIVPAVVFLEIFVYIPDTLSIFLFSQKLANIFDIIQSISPFISFIIISIIYCKTPTLKDNFFILQEMKCMMIALIFISITNLANTMLSSYDPNNTTFNYIIPIMLNLEFLSEFAAMMIATRWVLTKTKNILTSAEHDLDATRSHNHSIQAPLILAKKSFNNNIVDSHEQTKAILIKTLSNKAASETFFEYLLMDLSPEIIVAFIELIQYQQFIEQHMDSSLDFDEKESEMCFLYKEIYFDESIPKSVIVFGDEQSWDNNSNMYRDIFLSTCKMKAHKLYLKFIEYGVSEFEINITEQVRENLNELMQDKHEWLESQFNLEQLLILYNGCCLELFESMLQSFNRFQQTSKYQQLQSYL